MAQISLRAYLKEIDNLIERGLLDEAIAHSKHILASYPKAIDAYRILGKAFLEKHLYPEAGDLFQRVLAVVPDDFIAHIGMSIIREDEHNLDAAIWHMERAFDIQPSNAAIQDELRRLYGRRDGVQPPKVRLTRGALVRMYTRGNLQQQAIAEIKASLTENPGQVDLEIILARIYHQTNMLPEAAELCNKILKQLPYCYEANRILVDILSTTSRQKEAKAFQNRLSALDPYSAHLSAGAPVSSDVPDTIVQLEKLEYIPGQSESLQIDWSKDLEIQMEEPAEIKLPDWMESMQQETPPDPVARPEESFPAPSSSESEELFHTEDWEGTSMSSQSQKSPEEESAGKQEPAGGQLPDWLKAAGWQPSESSSEAEAGKTESEPEEEEPAPASLPDWLQSIAPVEETETSTPEPAEEAVFDFSSLFSDSSEEAKETPEKPTPPFEALATTAILPGFTFDDSDEIFEPPVVKPAVETPAVEDAFNGLTGEQPIEPEPSAPGDMPDWLSNFASAETPAETPADSTLPDWLHGLTGAQEEPASEEIPALDFEAEPASPAETPAESVESVETILEASVESVETVLAAPVETVETVLETPVEQSLEDTSPTAMEEQVQAPAETAAPAIDSIEDRGFTRILGTPEEEAPSEEPAKSDNDLPDWLKEFDQDSAPSMPSAAALESFLPPDWILPAEEEKTSAPQPEEVTPIEVNETVLKETSDDLMEWLRDLKPGAIAEPEEESPALDEVESASAIEEHPFTTGDLSTRLQQVGSFTMPAEEKTPFSTPFEIPDSPAAEEPLPEITLQDAIAATEEPSPAEPEPVPVEQQSPAASDTVISLESLFEEVSKPAAPEFTAAEGEEDFRFEEIVPLEEGEKSEYLDETPASEGDVVKPPAEEETVSVASLIEDIELASARKEAPQVEDEVIQELEPAAAGDAGLPTIDSLKADLEKNPEQAELWLKLGDLYSSSGQTRQALHAYTQAEKILMG